MLYQVVKLLLRPFFHLFYRIKVDGLENIPDNGAYIVCANHYSAVDPLMIGLMLPHRISFMAKAELFKNKLLGTLLLGLGAFPIKRGEADIKSIKTSLKILSEGKVLSLFPEGTRNRSDAVRAEPGIAMLSVKAKVPVVPVAVISDYKFLHRTVLKIGKPINLEEFYDQKLHSEDYTKVSIDIMKNIWELKRNEGQ